MLEAPTDRAPHDERWIEVPAPRGGIWMVAILERDAVVIAPPAVALLPIDEFEAVGRWRIGIWPLDARGWLARKPDRLVSTRVVTTADVLARLPQTHHPWVGEVMRLQLAQHEAFATPQAGGLSDEERSRRSARKLRDLREELHVAFPDEDWYTPVVDELPCVPDTGVSLLAAIDGQWRAPIHKGFFVMSGGCNKVVMAGWLLAMAPDRTQWRELAPCDPPALPSAERTIEAVVLRRDPTPDQVARAITAQVEPACTVRKHLAETRRGHPCIDADDEPYVVVDDLVASAGRPLSCDSAANEPVGRAEPITLPLPRSLHDQAGRPFVGREAELGCLHSCWAKMRGRPPSAVVVSGEPGIGKTHLASEFARALYGQGALVLYGRCDEGLALPYQPFGEALRPYAQTVGADRLRAELGHLAPELGRVLPELAGLGDPVRADPESERFALFEAIATLIESATRQQPALLIIDDLHWAADPTLSLLRHLIRSERSLGVLVLGLYRETEPDLGEPFLQLLADLHRDAITERLSIGGLDEPAIAALLEARIGSPLDEHARELAHALAVQTAGNPFFLRELVAHLTETGAIFTRGERPTDGVTTAQLELPKGLRQVIGQRVARLSAATGRALSVAAVAGTTFSFSLLERVLGEPTGVLDALDEAVAAGLLTEAQHGDYLFAHALVRKAIYDELGTARRMHLHRQVGEALEELDAQSHVEALAHHFAQATADGQGLKAAAYALAAQGNPTVHPGCEKAFQALGSVDRQPVEGSLDELAALRAGDEAAWTKLVTRFDPPLRMVVGSYRLSPSDTDDVMRLTWLRLRQNIDHVHYPSAIAGWLKSTARHESLRSLGAQRHEPPPVDRHRCNQTAWLTNHDLLAPERRTVLDMAPATLPVRHRHPAPRDQLGSRTTEHVDLAAPRSSAE